MIPPIKSIKSPCFLSVICKRYRIAMSFSSFFGFLFGAKTGLGLFSDTGAGMCCTAWRTIHQPWWAVTLSTKRLIYGMLFWLLVSIPLKNISQLGWLFPIYGKKHVPNHQPTGTRWFLPTGMCICCESFQVINVPLVNLTSYWLVTASCCWTNCHFCWTKPTCCVSLSSLFI